MSDKSILIIGGDKRQKYLYSSLKSKKYNVDIIFDKYEENQISALSKIPKADIIILPIPLTSNGRDLFAPNSSVKIDINEIAEKISYNSVVFSGGEHPAIKSCKAKEKINLLEDENMTVKNAMATAEAAISIIIKETDFTLFGAEITIIGYGRIGKILAGYLAAMHSKITVCARREEQRVSANLQGLKAISFDSLEETITKSNIIINTVPSPIIGKNQLTKINPETVIIDLASKPGGVDFKFAEERNIKAIHALSLPGKYSPKSAAGYIEQTIISNIAKE